MSWTEIGGFAHGLTSLTCFKLLVAFAALATFSLDTTRDRSATRIRRIYSCCSSASLSAKLVLAQASLLRFSVSSRTTRIRLSHSCVCSPLQACQNSYCSSDINPWTDYGSALQELQKDTKRARPHTAHGLLNTCYTELLRNNIGCAVYQLDNTRAVARVLVVHCAP